MSAMITKRRKEMNKTIEPGKIWQLGVALETMLALPKAKFDESVDVAFNLGVDPRKSDQIVRGSVVLPHGTGKTVRVAVFAQGALAEAATKAGAELVGFEDLAEKVSKGFMDFDMVIAAPDAMRVVGKLGPVLGPRGLMPNPKDGTVSPDVATAVKNAKAGQVRFRTDKNGIIHCTIGRASFPADKLKENLESIAALLKRLKPSVVKGIYMRKISISTTMGPSFVLEVSSVAM
jgi:large subunit ribosomal protein L1